MKHLESVLQIAAVTWFRYQYPGIRHLLFAIPNGGYRNSREAARMKSEGVQAGVPDLFLAVARKGKNGLFIEMKAGRNKLTPEQAAMLISLERQGYMTQVCRSFDDFEKIINGYMT